MFSLAEFYTDPESDTFRPPDWRSKVASAGLTVPGDKWCERSLAHRPKKGRRTADQELVAAYALYDGDPLLRAELEARVLLNQLPEEIALHCRLTSQVVEAYEAVFFDVRRHHGEPLWIIASVLEIPPGRILPTGDVSRLWKTYAYLNGAAVLDTLIQGADHSRLRELGVDAYLEPQSRLPNDLKAQIAADRSPGTGTVSEALARMTRLFGMPCARPQPKKSRRRSTPRN